MKATATIKCDQCGRELGDLRIDTADLDLEEKINDLILAHRAECPYHTKGDKREE